MKYQLIIAWFLSQGSISAILGDWFVFKNNYDASHVAPNCMISKGDAHNMFGKVCGLNLTSIFKGAALIQAFLLTILALNFIYFLTIVLDRNTLRFQMINFITTFLILGLSISVTITWYTSTTLLINKDNIYYHGWGSIFNIIVTAVSFAAVILNVYRIS